MLFLSQVAAQVEQETAEQVVEAPTEVQAGVQAEWLN
jgi:hypothetical protein